MLFIPSTTKKIKRNTFKSNIERITIQPSSQPLIIEAKAFYDCHNLQSFDFHSRPLIIKNQAFHGAGFTDIVLPKTVRLDGNGIFMNNKQLLNLTIEDGRRIIPDLTFSGCTELTDITLPNELEYLGMFSFANSGITNVVLSPKLKELQHSTFSECYRLKNVSNSSTLKRISTGCFAKCYELTKIELDNVEVIGELAFTACVNLKTVVANKVKNIGPFAFCACSELEHFNFPPTLTSINNNAFNGCDKFTPKQLGIIGIKLHNFEISDELIEEGVDDCIDSGMN